MTNTRLYLKKTSRKFSAAFKTKVVLEALKEQMTIQNLSSKFDVHSDRISTWKNEFLTNASVVFESGRDLATYIYPYLLRNLKVTQPNEVWQTDITYIPMFRGFIYLAVRIDLYSQKYWVEVFSIQSLQSGVLSNSNTL